MARRCTVCTHPRRAAIELDLGNGLSLRNIAKRHGISASAVHRHGKDHLGEGPGLSAVIDELQERMEVLEERAASVEGMQKKIALWMQQVAKELEHYRTVFGGSTR